MHTASMRRPGYTSIDHYPRDDSDPTDIGGARDRVEAQHTQHVARALRALPDWSIGDATRPDIDAAIAAWRATYSSDVSQDGLWSALSASAGLAATDLDYEWEG